MTANVTGTLPKLLALGRASASRCLPAEPTLSCEVGVTFTRIQGGSGAQRD